MEIGHPALIAVLAGEATEEERAALDEWRAANPAHDEAFLARARIWYMLGEMELRRAAASGAAPPSLRVIEGAQADPTPQRPPFRAWARPRRLAAWVVAAAASVVVAAGLGLFAPEPQGGALLGASSIVTGAGEVTTLTLNDGTVVRLGPESRLRFHGLDGRRDVFLEGQAYFAVHPGQKTPFRVHTAGGAVKVLGTRFDVQARGEDVRVVVVQGQVEMDADGHRVSVAASQMGRVEPAGGPVVQPVDDVYEATSWIGSFLVFESTPLTDVAVELEKRFGLRIQIVDPELAGRLITGWFADRSPEQMVASICWAVNARCTLQDRMVRFERPRDSQRGLVPQIVTE